MLTVKKWFHAAADPAAAFAPGELPSELTYLGLQQYNSIEINALPETARRQALSMLQLTGDAPYNTNAALQNRLHDSLFPGRVLLNVGTGDPESDLELLRSALVTPRDDTAALITYFAQKLSATSTAASKSLSARLLEVLVLSPVTTDVGIRIINALDHRFNFGLALGRTFAGGGPADAAPDCPRSNLLRAILHKSVDGQLHPMWNCIKTQAQLEHVYELIKPDRQLRSRCLSNLLTTALRLQHTAIFNEIFKQIATKVAGTRQEDLLRFAEASVYHLATGGTAGMMGSFLESCRILGLSAEGIIALVNTRLGSDEETALGLAAQRGDADLVRVLLAKGATINDCDNMGSTALHCAVASGHHTVLIALLDFMAHNLPPGMSRLNLLDTQNESTKSTALMLAVAYGQDAMVESLVRAGANMTICDKWGDDIFAIASNHNSMNTFWTLMNLMCVVPALSLDAHERASIMNRTYWSDVTALQLAIRTQRRDMVETLVLAGADLTHPENHTTAFIEAVESGNLETLQTLIEATCAQLGDVDAEKKLAALVNIECAAGSGDTALGAAVSGGHREMAAVLVRAGARVAALPLDLQDGYTALTGDAVLPARPDFMSAEVAGTARSLGIPAARSIVPAAAAPEETGRTNSGIDARLRDGVIPVGLVAKQVGFWNKHPNKDHQR